MFDSWSEAESESESERMRGSVSVPVGAGVASLMGLMAVKSRYAVGKSSASLRSCAWRNCSSSSKMVRETDMVGNEEILGKLMLGIGIVGDRVKRLLEIQGTGDELRACCRKKAWLEF